MKANRNFPIFDLAKALMCLLIAFIHTIPFNVVPLQLKILAPLTRIAVPIFFMISGYLFFTKIKIKSSHKSKWNYLNKMVLRNLKLYAFWMIILWPITYTYRKYDQFNQIKGTFNLIWNFLFGSTFIASWYLSALVIGLIIVFWLSLHLNSWQVFLVTLPAYFLCVMTSNYSKLDFMHFFTDSWLRQSSFIWAPYNSFAVALVWISISKLFVDYPNFIFLGRSKQRILLIPCIILLYVEQLIIVNLNSYSKNDCYFSLIPLCCVIFSIILHTSINLKNTKILRHFSTITYCLHASLNKLITSSFNISTTNFGYAFFFLLITVFFCVVITLAITKLQNFKYLQWLKYSY